ncbi:hypothetical protein PaeCFBP13512_18420 [Paenibacillus sp. CFBP13512]|uniref:hypothetical protein n=1 Tax=Paenibacillus sp. CFBP13512 TaxID=2184007 RepID=UPI0010C0E969|nr:hypothetical protein [Paenibacillus sp. CFBP13512]TKJ87198.1 hypothetical protein PaeCFBP13512_18420 [Paenibacillus sp. CFBP13512]
MDEIFNVLEKRIEILELCSEHRKIAILEAIEKITLILNNDYDYADILLKYFHGNQSLQTTILRLSMDRTLIAKEDLPVLTDCYNFTRKTPRKRLKTNGRTKVFTEFNCWEALRNASYFFNATFTRYQYDHYYKNLQSDIPSAATIMRTLHEKNNSKVWVELLSQVSNVEIQTQ